MNSDGEFKYALAVAGLMKRSISFLLNLFWFFKIQIRAEMFRDEKTGLIPSIHEGLMDFAANVLYQVLFSYLFFCLLIVTNQILGCMCFFRLMYIWEWYQLFDTIYLLI